MTDKPPMDDTFSPSPNSLIGGNNADGQVKESCLHLEDLLNAPEEPGAIDNPDKTNSKRESICPQNGTINEVIEEQITEPPDTEIQDLKEEKDKVQLAEAQISELNNTGPESNQTSLELHNVGKAYDQEPCDVQDNAVDATEKSEVHCIKKRQGRQEKFNQCCFSEAI